MPAPISPPMIDNRHTRSRPKRRNPAAGKTRLPRSPGPLRPEALWIYGLHPVLAALANPRRQVKRVLATPNALSRLRAADATLTAEIEETTPRRLDQLLGGEAVHQGVAIEVAPLESLPLAELSDARLLVVLDQVTDPHNIGAVM